jgi:hypothetical protein
MSDYERWTIYPLLLLTLGIVLKDKMLRPVADAVVCHKLSIVDGDGNTLIAMGPTEQHVGALEIFTSGGRPLVVAGPDAAGKHGVVSTFTDEGQPLVEMSSHGGIGRVVAHGPQGIAMPLGPLVVVPRQPANPSEKQPVKKEVAPRADQPKDVQAQPGKNENPSKRP